MPVYTTKYLEAVRAYLQSQHRPNDLPSAIRWTRRLMRPLCQGARVDTATVLRGPVRT